LSVLDLDPLIASAGCSALLGPHGQVEWIHRALGVVVIIARALVCLRRAHLGSCSRVTRRLVLVHASILVHVLVVVRAGPVRVELVVGVCEESGRFVQEVVVRAGRHGGRAVVGGRYGGGAA